MMTSNTHASTITRQKLKPSYIREILQAATNDEVISLAGGLPAETSFPYEQLRKAASIVLTDPTALQYSITEGEPELRQWVATYLDADINQILITSGAQQAMDLVTRALIQPGDGVVVEAPAYLGALQIFTLARANIIAIEQTSTGPDLNQLESAFQRGPKIFYAVPDFHNPTGCCWPKATRKKVLALASQYGVAIIEDAPYRELRYGGTTVPSLYELAPERVCHTGSFSKTTAPGLRLGFLCANKALLSQVSLIKQATDLHSSTLCQRLLLSCLQEPFYSAHINGLRNDYRHRRNTLVAALQDQLGDKISFEIPEGGMFLWLSLASGNTDKLADQCPGSNVVVVPGSVFYPDKQHGCGVDKPLNKIRLNFTHTKPELLTEGVKRLAAVINGM